MTYTATWANGNAQGRIDPAAQWITLSDPEELADAINRRRLVTYQSAQDYSSRLFSGAYVGGSVIAAASAPPFDNFRTSVVEKILNPPLGGLGGTPPSPESLYWLWPESDPDENKIIVSGVSGVPQGKVGLLQKINGTDHWTDPLLTAARSAAGAVHVNELRVAMESLRRGRWTLPIYFAAGIISVLPDAPWIGNAVANNGTDELRSLGFAYLRTDESPVGGLTNITVRSSSTLEITADYDCAVNVYRCKRPIDYLEDLPTWNEYNPGIGAWSVPGAGGADDAEFIGSIGLTANTPGTVSNDALRAALQAMADGAEQNFLVRRADAGYETITISGRVAVEFDLDAPPN